MFAEPRRRVLLCAATLLTPLTLVALGSPARAAAAYEAEDAAISRGVVESNHPGYTGTGFVNYDNVAGSYVEFTVQATSAGTEALTLRYANGTTVNRPMDITVNGALVAAGLAFPGTGGWPAWRTTPVTATLNAGANVVRATAATSNGGPNVDSLSVGEGPPSTDWSTAMVESTMRRHTPAGLGGWSYTRGLYLYGQYLVYQRTRDPRHLAYIKAWADRFVDSDGSIGQGFSNLDSMESGNVLLILARETGQSRYRIAAQKIRDRLRTYPRTSDGGWWHSTSDSRQGQLWADGVFMVDPFVIRYGQQFGEATWGDNESARQLEIYASHLLRTTGSAAGLLYHAYDEPGGLTASWVKPSLGNTNGISWCRAIGWYGMATIDILELLPAAHPRRAALITILRQLVDAYVRWQDPGTGRWWQVVTEPGNPGNWTETSCSAMYSFTISRAVQRGYVDAGHRDAARRGYQGVLARLSVGSDGLTTIREISEGTNVDDVLSYYFNRPRPVNDFHGLGAFLIMNEQMIATNGG